MPHGRRDKLDLPFKLEVAHTLIRYLKKHAGKKIIIATDFNIARSNEDVCKSKENINNTMFTFEERQVIAELCKLGYYDSFRELFPQKISYTWWTYAFDARKRNIGWRIDYFFVTEKILKNVIDIEIDKNQEGSDHCPTIMTLNRVGV